VALHSQPSPFPLDLGRRECVTLLSTLPLGWHTMNPSRASTSPLMVQSRVSRRTVLLGSWFPPYFPISSFPREPGIGGGDGGGVGSPPLAEGIATPEKYYFHITE
jgi:hypothetical protein